ncbi:hypothetical protein [Geomicrobium sp. JCM 19055]|uniref:DUF6944 family repetitive protein n=1 Tax=Geomicrobium sp. JCM 19055 TaxID=1460649 RepID=UPI00045ECC6B|nr:hypothetical protein [Geomicrobium sp. JCM 19055]GAK00013.1 hypothetical protein JCM19055_3078 [Geomicrobium sp. JCM 19055]
MYLCEYSSGCGGSGDGEYPALIGSWAQAIGTVISAIGGTPILVIGDGNQPYAIIGNSLQAVGAAVLADEADNVLDQYGNIIPAIGNVIVLRGVFLDDLDLAITGDLFQATGGSLSIYTAIQDEELVDFYANGLQVVGNGAQALAGIQEKQDIDSEDLAITGGWIQATGAIIAALQETYDYLNPNETEDEDVEDGQSKG